jgi:hypothetical protein
MKPGVQNPDEPKQHCGVRRERTIGAWLAVTEAQYTNAACVAAAGAIRGLCRLTLLPSVACAITPTHPTVSLAAHTARELASPVSPGGLRKCEIQAISSP